MELTPKDIELFKGLSTSDLGKQLVDYLERLKVHIFNPKSVTKDNIDSFTQLIKLIDDEMINKIKLTSSLKGSDPNPYV